MANLFQEQLLKAGLVTQEQIDKINQPKPEKKPPNKNRNTTKPRSNPAPHRKATPSSVKTPKPSKPQSDLERFYKEREQLERHEREEAERLAHERAARKKQVREQIQALIQEHTQNVEEAEIRYNFVVGDNIKYVYVTEAQQQALAEGTLAITFLKGRRCLIPSDIAAQLLALDPDKLVIINHPEETGSA